METILSLLTLIQLMTSGVCIDVATKEQAIASCKTVSTDLQQTCYSLASILHKPCATPTPVPVPSTTSLVVWANTGEDKVTKDDQRASKGTDVSNPVWDGATIKQFGAKNEVVSFNLVLEAPTKTVAKVNVKLANLVGPNNFTISSKTTTDVFDWVGRQIELFYVRYLPIKGLSRLSYGTYDERHVPKRLRRPYTGEGIGSGVWLDRPDHDKLYPEIAVPIELMSVFDIALKENQSIWVDVYIPKTAPTGVYTGKVQITEDGTLTKEIPVQLTVRNFTLPDLPNSKTMVYLGYADVNKRYLGNAWPSGQDTQVNSIRDKHFQVAHRHKLSLVDSNVGSTTWNTDAPRSEWLSRLNGTLFTSAKGYEGVGTNTGNNVYSIGQYGSWTWQTQGESGMRTHTDAWANWFTANSPTTEVFLYLIDESSDFATIEQWAKWINNNPGVGKNIMSMATIAATNAYTSTPSLDVVASWMTVGVTSAWNTATSKWITNTDKRMYLYNGKRPSNGSFAIEDDGIALRELSWAQYKKKIHRWYFWESVYYNNYQAGAGETNVFQQAKTFGATVGKDGVTGEYGWNYSNGDGVLFYPGTDKVFPTDSYNVLGPFVSLRMKHWRRGIQDVDYLVLANAKNPTAVTTLVNTMVPKAFWEYGVNDVNDPSWVRTDISWSTDPTVWENARKQLATIIDGQQ